jgi:DNA-binding IclR family transcriptional regulator
MIQVINRAIDILEYVARNPKEAKPLSEIAESLNLNAGTCSNIIKTLVGRKFLEQSAKRKGYILGRNAYLLTGNEGYKQDLIEAAKLEMPQLVEQFNENALLAVLNKDKRTVIYRINSDQELQVHTKPEKKAYHSSSGRLLISMLSDKELNKFVEKYGLPDKEDWEEAADITSFKQQVAKIREREWAIQMSQNQIIGIAVPVYQKEKVLASLSLYLPLLRYNVASQDIIIDALKEVSKKIGKKLK